MDCVAHQASPSMEFFRQEYWSGLPYPSPGDLPDAGSLLHLRQILYHLTHQGSPQILVTNILILPASMSLITLKPYISKIVSF